ncbi:MAG: peptidylprolyl isomerase [Candidatus Cloacimonetes bacterium]|nr:peptidylprolyl isomerase [Candidatus Cloacimonadota bacterium]
MKKTLFAILLVCLGFSLMANDLVDRILAKVGNEIILLSDVQKNMLQMRAAGVPAERIDPNDVLSELIEQRLILQKAQELDIKLNDERIRQYAEGYIKQIKARYPSEEEYRHELQAMQTTESELLDYYITVLKEQALTEQLVERFVTSKAIVTETEMREFYTDHKDSLAVKPVTWQTGMIMKEIKPSKAARNIKLQEINALLTRVMDGEDFATVAREASDCPSSARGGDLGFFGKGMMVKPFEDAAFDLAVDEVSGVVESDFGFHIIKLTEKRGKEIRASHILKIVEPSLEDSLAAWDLMEDTRASIMQGTDFGNLAAQLSDDKESAQNQGIIGEFDENGMPELFRSAILGTQIGEPTPVLHNEGTLYIFIRTQELEQRVYTYDEVKDEIGALLAQQKQIAAYTEWIEELTKESWVQVLP